MIRFDNTYIGKQVIFKSGYTERDNIIIEGTTGTIIDVISSYEALVSIKGINTPIRMYNHCIDGIHVIIK